MAVVYQARDVATIASAIKILHPELAAVLGAERFLIEQQHITANLQHPHILPLFDSGTSDRQLYYVMPLVEGESLRGRLNRERQLSIDDVVRRRGTTLTGAGS